MPLRFVCRLNSSFVKHGVEGRDEVDGGICSGELGHENISHLFTRSSRAISVHKYNPLNSPSSVQISGQRSKRVELTVEHKTYENGFEDSDFDPMIFSSFLFYRLPPLPFQNNPPCSRSFFASGRRIGKGKGRSRNRRIGTGMKKPRKEKRGEE